MRRVHDFGDPGLLSAPNSVCVGRDDVVADLIRQCRMIGDTDDLRGIGGSAMSPP